MDNWPKNEKNVKFPLNIMENCPKGLKYPLSGRMEIHPCIQQDIGPLGPLPCSHSTASADHSKQGIGYRWPCAILGWLVFLYFSCGCGLTLFLFLAFCQSRIVITSAPQTRKGGEMSVDLLSLESDDIPQIRKWTMFVFLCIRVENWHVSLNKTNEWEEHSKPVFDLFTFKTISCHYQIGL